MPGYTNPLDYKGSEPGPTHVLSKGYGLWLHKADGSEIMLRDPDPNAPKVKLDYSSPYSGNSYKGVTLTGWIPMIQSLRIAPKGEPALSLNTSREWEALVPHVSRRVYRVWTNVLHSEKAPLGRKIVHKPYAADPEPYDEGFPPEKQVIYDADEQEADGVLYGGCREGDGLIITYIGTGVYSVEEWHLGNGPNLEEIK